MYAVAYTYVQFSNKSKNCFSTTFKVFGIHFKWRQCGRSNINHIVEKIHNSAFLLDANELTAPLSSYILWYYSNSWIQNIPCKAYTTRSLNSFDLSTYYIYSTYYFNFTEDTLKGWEDFCALLAVHRRLYRGTQAPLLKNKS